MRPLVLSRAICCLGAFSCAQECNVSGYSDWWETAIVADIQALIVLGLDVMARGDHRQTALHRATIINDDPSYQSAARRCGSRHGAGQEWSNAFKVRAK